MYLPRAFQIDRATSLAFADARGFGTLVAAADHKPIASPAPFLLEYAADGTPQVSFHLARGNPLVRLADGATPWLLAVNGADSYLSPDWYASPDQVPTWLYQTVHLSGPVSAMAGSALAAHLDALSAKFEARLAPKPPWTSGKMTPGRLDAMMQAIVGLTMTVGEVEGSFKLNQHKSDADHAGVVAALSQQGNPHARELAATMHAMRPQAFEKEPEPAIQATDVA